MTHQAPQDQILTEIHAAGWSYGHTAYRDKKTGTTVHVADAHKNGQRCVARGDTLLTAYSELRALVVGADKEQDET